MDKDYKTRGSQASEDHTDPRSHGSEDRKDQRSRGSEINQDHRDQGDQELHRIKQIIRSQVSEDNTDLKIKG